MPSSISASVSISLALIGDVMLGRGVNETLGRLPPESPWGDTLSVLRSADFRICNLECAISDRGSPQEKKFCFRSDARNIAVLEAGRINAVSMANNHALDFGCEALADTLALLDRAGIAHAGAGANLDQAFAPGIASMRGTKIGLLSFTDNEPLWEAGRERPGIAYVPVDLTEDRAMRLLRAVESARREVDILVVAAHWGRNWGYRPPHPHFAFGRELIERGADIVFGHSAHVFRGVEIYRGRPILYGTGNFIDDYAVDSEERNDESFIFMVDIDAAGPRAMHLHPTVIHYCQAALASNERVHAIMSKMVQLSREMGTTIAASRTLNVLELPMRGCLQ